MSGKMVKNQLTAALPPGFLCLGLLLFVLVMGGGRPALAVTVTVDNTDTTTDKDTTPFRLGSTAKLASGAWGTVANDATAYPTPSGSYRFSSSSGTRENARWYPKRKDGAAFVAGTYDVYAWWVNDNINDAAARYYLERGGGTSCVYNPTYATYVDTSDPDNNYDTDLYLQVNQQAFGGQWVLLATCAYPGTTSDYVMVRESKDNTRVVADAVKFVTHVACPDQEGDGVCDAVDNCPAVGNLDQFNSDTDSLGNACDNCDVDANEDQADADGDLLGDVCDKCPSDANNDVDGDGVCGNVDNCPYVANPAPQADSDGDGIGDACDCPDADTDNVCDQYDNCPTVKNTGQQNKDGDALGDACDACPSDASNDVDGDGVCGDVDNCPTVANPAPQADSDGDGIGDACEVVLCPSANISDIPLDATLHPAPANVMFLLDDSGSMAWSFLTSEDQGRFSGAGDVFGLDPTDEAKWQSQWSGYNKIYYNPSPAVTYDPWPIHGNVTGPADPNTPRNHPNVSTSTLTLDSTYTTIDSVNIPNSHYYTWADTDGDGVKDAGEDSVYLVTMKSTDTPKIKYYLATLSSGSVTKLTLVAATALPATVITYWPATDTANSYTKERQRFANWYSFYRKRGLVALGAMAKVITNMKGVYIGIMGINNNFAATAPLPVIVGSVDSTATLLDKIYAFDGWGSSTPLRVGLENVGKYFDQTDGTANGGVPGASPWATEALGGSCQQGFAIAMTDGYDNTGTPSIAAADSDNNKGVPYADIYDNTMGDVAMKYYSKDLEPALPNTVPTNSYDKASWQHMVTYGVSFGLYGTLNPADWNMTTGKKIADPNKDTLLVWPQRVDNEATTIDDLWHSTVNGRGAFYSAGNSKELVDSIVKIMESIEDRVGSSASVSVNGDELFEEVSGNIMMYQTSFSSDGWGGDVKAFNIDPANGKVITEPTAWKAEGLLKKAITDNGATNRVIATSYNTCSGSPAVCTTTGVPFRYPSLSVTQQAFMAGGTDFPGITGTQMVDYLRGDKTKEIVNGGLLRSRLYSMGDFVNSSATFANDILYAGSNDGMLHALNAQTGRELWSYIPGLLVPELRELAYKTYTHQYYVDMEPFIKKMGATSLLVGALGKGGKGIYCLDVSNSLAITTEAELAAKVKWEFPATSFDGDMGFSFSKAFIIKTKAATLNAGTDLKGYVVVFGNGYQSTNGHAVLFVLNPLTGAVIKRLDTGVGNCNGLSTPATVDVNGDEYVDYLYAGDLKGNLWKFDLTSSNPADWGIAYKNASLVPQPLFTAQNSQPITTKPDVALQCNRERGYLVTFGTGKFLSESDMTDTTKQTIYGIWDYGDDSDDREYLGTFNPLSGALSNQPAEVKLLQQTSLVEKNFTANADGETLTKNPWLRVLSNNPIHTWSVPEKPLHVGAPYPDPGIPADADGKDNDGDGVTDESSESYKSDGKDNDGDGKIDLAADPDEGIAHAGWYFDLPIPKERVIVDPMIRNGNLIAITFVPKSSPCSGGGSSIIMEMDVCSGGRLPTPALDINDDGKIDKEDEVWIDDPAHPGEEIRVPPTGLGEEGRLQTPAILRDPDEDKEYKYSSTSTGAITVITEKKEKRGTYYWQKIRR